MQRLIDDANELRTELGLNADLSIDRFSDIIEAIHLIQEELGITGTTAAEASDTIQGSIATAKAAYQNWLAALADSNANVAEKTDLMVESITTAAENIAPVIEQVLGSLGTVLEEKLPGAMQKLFEYLVSNLPQLVMLAVETLYAMLEGVVAGLGTLGTLLLTELNNAVAPPVTALVENIMSALSTFGSAAKQSISDTFGRIAELISEKLELAKTTVSNAIDAIKAAFDFEWSLPHLKLPRITISGGFSLNPPSVPHFGLEWFAEGGILNGATIFGRIGNTFLGGGEAGPEAIAPISKLQEYVAESVSDVVGNDANQLLRSIDASLRRLVSSGHNIHLDITTEIDGATVARKTYSYNLQEQVKHGPKLINA